MFMGMEFQYKQKFIFLFVNIDLFTTGLRFIQRTEQA